MWNSMWNFIATLAKTYFSARFSAHFAARTNRTKKQPARTSKKTCTSAYYPHRQSISFTDEPHTVHVHHIILPFPSPLTQQEERRLTLLRHLIEIGEVNEEV